MEIYQAKVVDKVEYIPREPAPEIKEYASADLLQTPTAPATVDAFTPPKGGEPTQLDLGSSAVSNDLYRKLQAALKGEMDFSFVQPADPKADAKSTLQAAGIENPTEHNIQVYQQAIESGQSPDQAVQQVRNDPLVFDLNGDGDTNATVDQSGIEVDGATATKWAEKGDGVLAFGDKPLDTDGGKYQDAYGMLKAKAEEAGIDTSKGYLDKNDIAKLEEKGLTMMVSNGDGTNRSMKPSELGISQMSLGGKAVNKQDAAGNLITTEGSFVRNGQTQLVNDMWLNSIPQK